MELWIPVTLAAALFQTARFMLQKSLVAVWLSTGGATFARFVYSAPLVAIMAAAYLGVTGTALPAFGGAFWPYALVGGATQILATMCVVALFRHRNFAVGITFKKTEVVQTALVGLVVLGEGVSTGGFAAIVIGLVGVLLLSDPPEATGPWHRRVMNRAAGLGLLSGLLFAFSGVCYRGATLEIASADPLMRALLTLACVTMVQMLALGAWLAWREAGQIGAVLRAWRVAGLVGLTSMAGSLCWFTAFTLQNAAYVNALGQIELVFSFLAGALFFKERSSGRELGGIALLCLSILVLVLLR